MTRLLVCLLAIAAIQAAPACASAAQLFPEEVLSAGGEAGFAETMGEPALWTPDASREFPERIRLFIGGHTIDSWSIRLDRAPNGRWTGRFRHHDGHRLLPVRRFSVTDAEVQDLRALIVRARLWEIYPEFYAYDEEHLCIDGMIVILERLDAAGYRYAEGNAQCTLGSAQLAVAAKLMTLAGRPGLQVLLR